MDLDRLPTRIRSKIETGSPSECWPWNAALGTAGYGKVYWQGKVRESHRVVYELLVGPIPTDLDIDHTCHQADCTGPCPHRACQNPAHMRTVTRGTNVLAGYGHGATNARKTHCVNGHEFTPENTKMEGRYRRCLACRRERDRRRQRHR